MPAHDRNEEEFHAARDRQTTRVFRQQVLALAIFGLLVLAFSLWRAGWHNVFTCGWWRW